MAQALTRCSAPSLLVAEPRKVLPSMAICGTPRASLSACIHSRKQAGKVCGGVELVVTDPGRFRSYRAGVELLAAVRALAPEVFAWRRAPYEFVADRPAIDLLFGSARERLALEAGRPAAAIARAWEAEEDDFRRRRGDILLY